MGGYLYLEGQGIATFIGPGPTPLASEVFRIYAGYERTKSSSGP